MLSKFRASLVRVGCFFIFLVPTILMMGCHSGSHEEKHSVFQVTSPFRSDQDFSKEYVAQIHAIQHIEIRAYERGYLKEVFVDEGQLVEKGQKMFEIMPALKKAEYKKAKAEGDLARIEYKNTQKLAKRNVVSTNELALSKAKYQKALADQELAKIHLDFTLIKAPFQGLMDRFHVRLGSLVEEGELLTTLSDNNKMWVYFNVSETDYLEIKSQENDVSNLEVILRMANGKDYQHKGSIDTIEADFNNETGNIAFRATFPNQEGLLRHGETGTVLVPFPLKDVLIIPQKSTFEILDKKFVYVVDEDKKIRSKEIKIANELPHLYVVSSGLEEKDKVLLEGLGKVELGQEVEVDFKEPKAVVKTLDLPAE